MKKIYLLLTLLICFINFSFIYGQSKPNKNNVSNGHQLYKTSKIKIKQNPQNDFDLKPSQIRDKASDRYFYEFDRTCDPVTRKIPIGIKFKEEKFVKSKKSLSFTGKTKNKSHSQWINRGPFNVGGRTRALAIDQTNENIILAGGVSGGMWRSEDGGQSWKKVTRKFQNPSVTAIIQDPRPGYQHIWYYGGGERLGNSAGHNASFYTGTGIYKSQDGGRTWELLSSTADNSLITISPFDIINSMVIDPTNGNLYVATFSGLYRSIDGGISFQEVLSEGIDRRTEVAVTSQGKFYASIAQNGVFESHDGLNWLKISSNNFPLSISIRTIFAINPINHNEVYMYGTNGRDFLFKYNTIDKTYTELTNQLPERVAPIGGLNSQGSYNMVLKIHPTNPDLIIIGGTNLFRTTDGFRTKINSTTNDWIGGYSPRNDVSLYPNQHPDMHEVLFFPSNPNKVLNANDGGVFMTEDITTSYSIEEPVDWISLNNGYITTQPYTVSFDPESENEDLLAGFQDNGTWYTNQKDPIAFWTEVFGGDGSFNAFADQGRTRYMSSQRGNVFRLNYDENGDPISIAWVRPAGNRSFSFITPFILDPNNDNIMYIPAGRTLLRNSNLDDVPTVTNINDLNGPTDINWSEITKVESIKEQDGLLNNRELNNITALDVSTFPEANKLYYGTGQGQIFRMDFADLPSSKPIDIFTGKGLPKEGFVSSIHVDPNNSNKVVVSFSNYNIPSIFYTKDAGETWIDISGNLEENKDGTGNGPSVRWVAFLGNKDGILAGTSSGLYYTERILKENTVWQLENNKIGDGVVMQVRTRKDGLAALAVHGNGVYSKKFDVTPPWGEKTLFVNKRPDDVIFSIEETPRSIEIDLEDVFIDKFGGNSTIDITVESSDEDRDFIGYEFYDNKLEIYFFATHHQNNANIDKEGNAVIRLIATSGVERLATEFNVTVFQKPFLDTFDKERQFWPSAWPASESEDGPFGDASLNEMANQIFIPRGKKWTIERIKILGSADPFIAPNFSKPGTLARVRFYRDDNGKPGEQIIEMTNDLNQNPMFDGDIFSDPKLFGEYDLVLPEKVELEAGKYWISFTRLEDIFFINNIVWLHYIIESDDPDFNNKENAMARGFNFGPPSEEWDTFANLQMTSFPSGIETIPQGNAKLIFSLFGEVQDVVSNKLPDLNKNTVIKIYPNPSKDFLNIKFLTAEKINREALGKNTQFSIHNMNGKELYRSTLEENITEYQINTSNWAPGIYLVKVNGTLIKETIKIVHM